MYKYCKCIQLDKDRTYILKWGNGHEEVFSKEELLERPEFHKYIINLDIDGNSIKFKKPSEYVHLYSNLEGGNSTEESENAYRKSLLFKMIPPVRREKPTSIYSDDSLNLGDLIITDITDRVSSRIIRAQNVTFIGESPIFKDTGKYGVATATIRCSKAFIKNKCLIPSLLSFGADDSLVRIIAPHVEIDHDFIDIRTIDEVFVMLENLYNDSENTPVSAMKKLIIHFNSVGISNAEVNQKARKMINKILDDYDKSLNMKLRELEYEIGLVTTLAVTIHFAVSMYLSANCTDDYLIELAQICGNAVEASAFQPKGNDRYREMTYEVAKLMNK